MAENRTDIAIATAEAIDKLFQREIEETAVENEVGLRLGRRLIATFVFSTGLHQGPRVGRPRKPKAEA